MAESYLGDGLYVSFDGFQFKLRAPHGMGPDMEVYLEEPVLRNFLGYAKDIYKEQWKRMLP